MSKREFFSRVRKTVRPRPVEHKETDILGQRGSVRAVDATIYGSNWYLDEEEQLIEIYDAGPALVFRDLLPKRDKYEREGLYLDLTIAYRTTENAMANIRTFSGNHVTLANSVHGSMYNDPNTFYWVTDDMTLNVNSIYSGEKLWIQRIDWEWISREIVFYDELVKKGPVLIRSQEDIDAVYAERAITDETVRNYLIERVRQDDHFAKRCLALLNHDKLLQRDMISLYNDLGIES